MPHVREALLGGLRLAPNPRGPVFGMVTRVVDEKGFEILVPLLDRLLSDDVRLIILGEGDPAFETALAVAARKFPSKFAYRKEYDEKTAHVIEAGMDIKTDSDRVKLSRKMVLEFLGSSVDLSTAPQAQSYLTRYQARPERYGSQAENVHQPVKIDNDLYVRDYSKCILCYKCVEACGSDAQNTFAIAVAGRGFDAHISTEEDVPLPESACVYCGNCIGVCPTGALMFKSEHDMREAGTWDESRQKKTDTICPYCGVGCTLTLHTQDNRIVKVTSPYDHDITRGNLCIKGRFGWRYVQNRDDSETAASTGQPTGGAA